MDVFENWDHWIETPIGSSLLDHEQSWMDQSLENVFGYNAIQIGPSKLDCLRSNRIQCKIRFCFSTNSPLKVNYSNTLIVSQDFLPLESQSVDLFVLSHVLETVKNPHHFLREVERVLIPEGKLIICGFNPVSLWAIYRKFNENDFVVGMNKWIGISRLKDWCELLDLQIVGGQFSTYLPPINSQRWIKRFKWMESAGARWWPTAGAVYYLTAIKRNSCINLIRPKKWHSPNLKKHSAASIGKIIRGKFTSYENR
jgi:SAM-dependent methyltransferase